MPEVRCVQCGFSCIVTSGDHGNCFHRCVPGKPNLNRSSLPSPATGGGSLKVLLYYSYVEVGDVDGSLRWHKTLCEHLDLRGRVRVSPEGLNVILDGTQRALECYSDATESSGNFGHGIDFKTSDVQDGVARFPKLSCRPASHVVEMGVADELARPEAGATHLSVEEWHAMLTSLGADQDCASCQHAPAVPCPESDVVLLDVRNVYESRIGHFKCPGALTLTPDLRHFAEFPTFIDDHMEELRGKRVMMYCTGGVRCERASSYLLSKDVAKEVVQLKGGICRYLERYNDDGQSGFFHGKNFVFDNRRYEPRHDGRVLGKCDGCNQPWDDYDNGPEARCHQCRTLMLLCSKCRSSSAETFPTLKLFCGGDVCNGTQIRCGCGCSAEATSGPVCRRTGFFTKKLNHVNFRQQAAATRKEGQLPVSCRSAAESTDCFEGQTHSTASSVDMQARTHWGSCFDGVLGCSALFLCLTRLRLPARTWCVRSATLVEVDRCIAIVNEAYTAQYGAQRYKDSVAVQDVIRSGRMLVVCDSDSGEIRGCAVHDSFVPAETIRFGPVAVLPNYQKRGLGTALIADIERRATLAGCDTLQVEIRRHERGQEIARLYTRRGYEPCGPRHRNYIILSRRCIGLPK